MRALTPFILLFAAHVARAADPEGCADLKLLPRLEGCVIVECSAKQHDTFDVPDGSAGPVEGGINALTYTCPASMDLARIQRELDAELHKAGYLSVAPARNEQQAEAANPAGTARKGTRWLRWSASSEDGGTSYSLISASGGPEKFKAEACGEAPALAPLKQCEVLECASKAEDSVALRTAAKGETSLTGNVQSLTLACPAWTAAQALSTVEGEMKSAGYEILFRDSGHPEGGWLTGRSGQRWVEFASEADGESVTYALTVVPAAEVLTAAAPAAPEPVPPAPETAPVPAAPMPSAPAPAIAAVPAASPAPEPVSAPVIVLAPAVPAPAASAPAPAVPPAAASKAGWVPPKPLLQVQIEETHDRMYSVVGDLVINLLVDVAADGTVTQAVLAGRPGKDARMLESAALQAVSQWRFEPAHQDGRAVPAAKIPVRMVFHGRPWRL